MVQVGRRLHRRPVWARPGTPARRIVALTLGMALGGMAIAASSLWWGAPATPIRLSWWELVPAVVLADELGLHLEVRGDAHTLNFSEIPLVLGCFFAPPWAVILARLVGDAAFQGLRRKQRGVKLAFNLANFLLETTVLLLGAHLLLSGRPPTDWTSWPLMALAVGCADAASMLAVSCAIRWHGGKSKTWSVIAAGAATAGVNVSLALVTAVVLWDDPTAVLLLLVVLIAISLGYRSYTSLAKRHAGQKLLYDFTKVVGASMSSETVTDQLLRKACELLMAETAEIVLFDRATGRPAYRRRLTDWHATEGASGTVTALAPAEADWSRLVRQGHAVYVGRHDRGPVQASLREELGVRDFVLAPLLAEGAVLGTILVANRLGNVSTFDEEDCRLFETIANHASVAYDNSRLVEQLRAEAEVRRHEALHDALTGLPNRALFAQQVEAAIRAGGTAAVMLMDLDRFKEINDTLGHHHGDLLLREVANRLVGALRRSDTAARLGGDEFAVLVHDLVDVGEAEITAGRLLEALHQPFLVDELSLGVGASIGIAMIPDHGGDAAALLQKADVAMYEAKGAHDGAVVYSPERDSYSPRRLRLAGELREAIEAGDILVCYQPKARIADGRPVGMEALVRWRHPAFGMLSPDEFIPVAEQTGLIAPLTTYVLREGLRQCAGWRRGGHEVGVAVNLAVRSLLDVDLPDDAQEMLARAGVPPEALTLEITESSIMADPSRTITVLTELAAAGVRLSVDDFGTGYSSLTYLQRLPVHEVKVDKSFVLRVASNPGDAVIVQSIVELGHNLGLTVVAEGVEDQAAWDRLRSMDCDVAQGYLLGPPLAAPEAIAWLDRRRQGANACPEGPTVTDGSGGLRSALRVVHG